MLTAVNVLAARDGGRWHPYQTKSGPRPGPNRGRPVGGV